jgi:transketolase
MPRAEWFAEQDASYQEEVLPHAIRARIFGVTAQQADIAAWASLAWLSTAASPTTARGGSHELPA